MRPLLLNDYPAAKPPLKWAGGKRWLVPELQTMWQAHTKRRLVEPFAGGLAVSLGLNPKRALLNDINPHLINFYEHIRATGLPMSIELAHDDDTYYRHRAAFNQLVADGAHESKEAAELFYYLNRSGFNGLCRFNKSGEFNVPKGKYKTITYKADFNAYKDTFKRWRFSSKDFTELKLLVDDFVYADPPYDAGFTQYSQGGFGWEDQVRAAEWLARHTGPVLLSNRATPRILKLYRALGYTINLLDAPRRISSSGDRTKVKEVLATRNLRQ